MSIILSIRDFGEGDMTRNLVRRWLIGMMPVLGVMGQPIYHAVVYDYSLPRALHTVGIPLFMGALAVLLTAIFMEKRSQ